MKRAVFMLTLLCMVSIAFAQHISLTAREQASLKEQAVKKVKSFQESCKTIADSDIPFYKKTSKDGYIDVTMLDFMDGARIRITSLDGKSFEEKAVKQYLKKLALLSNRVYKEVHISSFYCAVSADFVPDLNKGKDWYVGEVQILQVFRAIRKGEYNVDEVSDKVIRKTKVYAKRGSLIVNSRNVPYWDVKLGNITAKNID